jgi:hypothetical protein
MSNIPDDPDKGTPSFSAFFQKYVNAWVAAAIALPTAITWKGMPMYESQRGILTAYTALSCVLILAFLFYVRNQLTIKLKSRIGKFGLILLPLGLICATAFCGYKYHQLLVESASYISIPLADAEKTLSLEAIHGAGSIIVYYILTMVFAESRFELPLLEGRGPRSRFRCLRNSNTVPSLGRPHFCWLSVPTKPGTLTRSLSSR